VLSVVKKYKIDKNQISQREALLTTGYHFCSDKIRDVSS
jgi:hypothetical protein